MTTFTPFFHALVAGTPNNRSSIPSILSTIHLLATKGGWPGINLFRTQESAIQKMGPSLHTVHILSHHLKVQKHEICIWPGQSANYKITYLPKSLQEYASQV